MHTLLDYDGNLTAYINITNGKTIDNKGAYEIPFLKGSVIVADRFYNDFSLLNVWDSNEVFFVIRHKENLQFSTVKENELPENLINKDLLQQKLLKEYQKFNGLLQSRNLNSIIKEKLDAEKEISQAFFYDKKTNEKFLSNFLERWGQENLKMQPLENYKLNIYGNGKIATLIDVVDGGSPLWGNYEVKNGKFKNNTYLLYFHIPKGKKELEVIR